MSQELYPTGQRHCYSCIQWDGIRTFDHEKGKVKVDASSLGTCRVTHAKTKGTSHCDNYFALR